MLNLRYSSGTLSALHALRFTLHTVVLLSTLICSTGTADEKVRIAGMGGVRIGMNAPDAGLFGNPAALLEVEANNLSVALSIENYHYEELPETPLLQFASELTLDSRPSIYYSRSYGDWGISVGYTATLENDAEFEVEETRSVYIVDQQQFLATTNMLTNYNLLWEYGWGVGFSKKLDEGVIGIRLKRLSQNAKRGLILSAVNLDAQHGSDVNINDPRELIPAIIDAIDFSEPTQYFDAEDQPTQDLTVTKFELDLGYQRDFAMDFLGGRRLRTGLVIENLLQRKLVEPLPLRFGIGAAYQPLNWIAVGLDTWRVSGHRGLDFAIGWELHDAWERGFTGAVALRGGLSRIDTVSAFSLGVSFALGSAYWEYTLSKRFHDQPLSQATHLFASTVRF
ncbi:MAG: hypothetical protein O7E52_16945 [Candidatus Poribacteria bacterium]|nr:hypothetical protein [Candidatus Poribacteria bacterium]